MEKFEFCGTLSLKKANEARLCNFLSHHLPNGTYRTIQKDKIAVHAQGMTVDGKSIKYKFLLSTGMEFGPKCIQDPPVPTLQSKTPVKFEDLKKLKISDLDKILNDLNLPKGK